LSRDLTLKLNINQQNMLLKLFKTKSETITVQLARKPSSRVDLKPSLYNWPESPARGSIRNHHCTTGPKAQLAGRGPAYCTCSPHVQHSPVGHFSVPARWPVAQRVERPKCPSRTHACKTTRSRAAPSVVSLAAQHRGTPPCPGRTWAWAGILHSCLG
jgi:hypothetical protein